MKSRASSGNILLSLMGGLLITAILAVVMNGAFLKSSRARRIKHESERFLLFLQEMVVRSSYSAQPLTITISKTAAVVTADTRSPQTFLPQDGISLTIRSSDPSAPREIRYARSCTPTTFALSDETSNRRCAITLSLRCRVNLACGE